MHSRPRLVVNAKKYRVLYLYIPGRCRILHSHREHVYTANAEIASRNRSNELDVSAPRIGPDNRTTRRYNTAPL